MDRRSMIASGAALAAGMTGAASFGSARTETPAKAAVRRFYEPFINGNVDLYDELLTENWTEHPPAAPGQQPGRAGYKPVVAGVRAMMPDISFTVDALVEEGSLVSVRSTLSATHTTDAFGVPATGRRFAIMTMDMHRFEGNRIAETWHVEDWTDMMRQIGAVTGNG
jgi:steroid delta-isomerase-like uncharacterized protein